MKLTRLLIPVLGILALSVLLSPRAALLPAAAMDGLPGGALKAPAARVYLPYIVVQQPPPPHTPTPTATPTRTPTAGGCADVPVLIGPPNGSTVDTLLPLFQWDSGGNPAVTEFRLHIWLDPEMTHGVYGLRCSTSACLSGAGEWRANRNLEPGTRHYWRANLICGSSAGPFTELWSFTTGSGGTILPGPALVSPADGVVLAGQTVTLQWEAVSGALEYWVWYSGDRDYGRLVNGTSTTLSGLRPGTAFEWWVQGRNDYALGADSPHWHFTSGGSAPSAPLPAGQPLRQAAATLYLTGESGPGVACEQEHE